MSTGLARGAESSRWGEDTALITRLSAQATRVVPRSLEREFVGRVPDLTSLNFPARARSGNHELGKPQGILDRFASFIEGPWAPDPADLPAKRHPTMSGNATEGFYTKPADRTAAAERLRTLRGIHESEVTTKLSSWTTVYEYSLPLPVQHRGLDGLRILHLSDVHLLKGHSRPTDELGLVAEFTKRSHPRPDIVIFTGDLITRSPDDLNAHALEHLRLLSGLAQHSFWVPGNHDFHGHTPELISSWMQDAGFVDLTNLQIDLNRRGSPFSIYGIDDCYFGSPTAPEQVDPDRLNIVMTHNLDAIRSNFPSDVFAFFSGHTHGGETWLPGFVHLMNIWGYLEGVNRSVKDWSVLNDTGSLSYVSRGLARYYCQNPLVWLPPGVTFHTLRAV